MKIGDVCIRASRILGKGSAVVVEAEIPDAAIVHALEHLRSDKFHQGHAVLIVTATRRRRPVA